MHRKLLIWSRRYQAALRTHLSADDRESLGAVRDLGHEVLAAGLPMLELAKLHEQFLVSELLPGCPARKRAALIKRAGKFFAAAVIPNLATASNGADGATHLASTVEALSQRTVELAASNLALSAEINRRKAVEEALKQKESGYAKVIKESARLQEHLRQLSRQILSAQENERKEISRELHDMVAQTLTGINIRLAALKAGATLDARSLARNIAATQRLVEHSVTLVHRFARELRPAVLDDLGLIRHGQPARTNQRSALNNSRKECMRCGASSFIRVKYGGDELPLLVGNIARIRFAAHGRKAYTPPSPKLTTGSQ